MAAIKRAVFSGLCFCILLSVRFILNTKFATDEIYRATTTSESNFTSPLVSLTVREKTNTTSTNESIVTSSNSFTALFSLKSDSHALCSREQIREGSWEPVILDAPPYVPSTAHLRCYPEKEYKKGHWMHTYKWNPHASSSGNCNFDDWDREEFCRITKRSTILIIGDSLSFEHYRSLSHMLGLRISQLAQHESKEEEKNIVNYACKKQTRIVYRRDDLLLNVTHAIFEQKTFPQVVVINRGAHYQNDTLLMTQMDQVVEELKDWKSQCEIFNITCHLIWRTSVPGHPKCQDNRFTKPVNDVTEMEEWINDRSNYDNRTIKYHWFDYQHQNEMVVDMLTKQQSFSQEPVTPFFFEVMDAYYLNVLRPDEHRSHQGDCLHSCYPGKMDVYNQLLLHFLKQQRSQSDIDSLIAWQDNRMRIYNNN